jgi:transcriptional regulator with XRE-family HTH domain
MDLNPGALSAWRRQRGLSKTELARLAETSAGYLCDIERGNARPSPAKVRRLADALKVTVADLCGNVCPTCGSPLSEEVAA